MRHIVAPIAQGLKAVGSKQKCPSIETLAIAVVDYCYNNPFEFGFTDCENIVYNLFKLYSFRGATKNNVRKFVHYCWGKNLIMGPTKTHYLPNWEHKRNKIPPSKYKGYPLGGC